MLPPRRVLLLFLSSRAAGLPTAEAPPLSPRALEAQCVKKHSSRRKKYFNFKPKNKILTKITEKIKFSTKSRRKTTKIIFLNDQQRGDLATRKVAARARCFAQRRPRHLQVGRAYSLLRTAQQRGAGEREREREGEARSALLGSGPAGTPGRQAGHAGHQ
jgi:hypothetical protein